MTNKSKINLALLLYFLISTGLIIIIYLAAKGIVTIKQSNIEIRQANHNLAVKNQLIEILKDDIKKCNNKHIHIE